MSESQWLFSLDALDFTPSTCSREREFYDRARGVEFLFRLGASLGLSVKQCLENPEGTQSYLLGPLRPCVLRQLGSIDSSCAVPCRTSIARYIIRDVFVCRLVLTDMVSTLLRLVSFWRPKLKSAGENCETLQDFHTPKPKTRVLIRYLRMVR
jgi:hypothetical protein